VILRRGQDRHVLGTALAGLSDLDQLHAVRFRIEFLPVGFELRVVGDVIIVTEMEAELFLRRGDPRLRG
jgi:hypothetical protein